MLWDIVEQHLDEAAFLFGQWEAALVSPSYTLASVADGPEERLLAHVDGLLVAGTPVRERLLEPALADDDRTRVFAAALVLLESPGRDRFDHVVARLDAAEAGSRVALARALQLAHRPGIDRELLALAAAGNPRRVGPALDALAFRRVPVSADLFRVAGAVQAADVLPTALRAARFAGARAFPFVDRALRSPVAAVREAALEAGLVLGLRSAWAACQSTVKAKEPGCGFALLGLALGGEPSDADVLIKALAVDALRPAALFAAGFTGRVEAADACAAHLRDEKVTRLAAEAFSAITGLAIRGEFRATEPPPRDEPIPLEQEDLDADVVPGLDAALPVPAPDVVEAWWKRARPSFDPRVRYLGGKPHDAASLQVALIDGPMRRRHALGLELAIRTRGEYALQTRGWATDQLRYLTEHGVATRPDFGSPFGKLLRG